MDLIAAISLVVKVKKRSASGLSSKCLTMTVTQFVEEIFLPSIRRASSRKTQLSRFNAHIRPVLGHRLISQITRSELLALIEQLRPSSKCRRFIDSIKASTRNRVVDALKSIFRKAYELELIDTNIATGLQKLPERNQRMRVLREDEQTRFFLALKVAPINARLLISLLILTGMRLGEALSARWDYVNLDNRTIRLLDTKGGRPRVVPLSEEACAICRELQGIRCNAFLFPGRGDSPMSRPSRQIAALFAAAGLEGFWVHDLRRSFATRIAEVLPMHAVSAILGHSSTAVTERYLVTSDQRLHDAADCIGRQFAPLISGSVGSGEPS